MLNLLDLESAEFSRRERGRRRVQRRSAGCCGGRGDASRCDRGAARSQPHAARHDAAQRLHLGGVENAHRLSRGGRQRRRSAPRRLATLHPPPLSSALRHPSLLGTSVAQRWRVGTPLCAAPLCTDSRMRLAPARVLLAPPGRRSTRARTASQTTTPTTAPATTTPMSKQLRHFPADSLFVSEPPPEWFGNAANKPDGAWSNANWCAQLPCSCCLAAALTLTAAQAEEPLPLQLRGCVAQRAAVTRCRVLTICVLRLQSTLVGAQTSACCVF